MPLKGLSGVTLNVVICIGGSLGVKGQHTVINFTSAYADYINVPLAQAMFTNHTHHLKKCNNPTCNMAPQFANL